MSSQFAKPAVTAVVATRKRPMLLRRAVRNIVEQDYAGDVECIVVFDRCDVQLPDIAMGPGRTLTGVVNKRSPGLAGARNTGIELAKSEYVAFCDDDDYWLPTKLTRQIPLLTESKRYDIVVSGISIKYKHRTFTRIPPFGPVTSETLETAWPVVHSSTWVARKSTFFGEVGLVDEAIPGSYGEDRDLLIRASRVKPLGVLPEVAVVVQWGSGSLFERDWENVAEAVTYLMDKHPGLTSTPSSRARMLGKLAFAYAAAGRTQDARRTASAAMRANWRQPRTYLALAVSSKLTKPERLMRFANTLGRGI